MSRAKLVERCAAFARGEWLALIKTCRADAESGNAATSHRRQRDTSDDLSKRAKKALQLVQWGALSTARQALEGAAVARGSERTLAQLTDPVRRPELPRSPIAREFTEHNPHEQVELCGEVLLKNLRSSRRGVAAGPSGMTGEHLRVILDSESDSDAFTAFACTLAVVEVPHEIMKAIRLGRMTALRKPDGGVRGIVVGDFLRRLVARTLAQQFSKAVWEATAPFQFALSTKAGTEAVTHALQALTSLDEDATVVSIDGVGAFDLISRNAMVSGLMAMEHGDTLWPFVCQFYG